MRSRKFLIITAVIIILLSAGLFVLLSVLQPPTLAEANCQPGDLGKRYMLLNSGPDVPVLPLPDEVVESYAVSLIDHQLSYTVLECSILRYPDEDTAHQALETVCTERQENPDMGDEACSFATNAPANLAFRRDAFLVLMSGDITDVTGPATAVDARLR